MGGAAGVEGQRNGKVSCLMHVECLLVCVGACIYIYLRMCKSSLAHAQRRAVYHLVARVSAVSRAHAYAHTRKIRPRSGLGSRS